MTLRRGIVAISAGKRVLITDPEVVDRILAHLEAGGGNDPFDARAPPGG
jgi:hypothetical protein